MSATKSSSSSIVDEHHVESNESKGEIVKRQEGGGGQRRRSKKEKHMKKADYDTELSFRSSFVGQVKPLDTGKYTSIVYSFRKMLWRSEEEDKKHFNFIVFNCVQENVAISDAGKASWDDVVGNRLRLNACAYLVFQYDYVKDPSARFGSKARRPRHKNIFLTWTPKKARKWEKRLYTIMKPSFRSAFGTTMIHLDLNASSKSDIKSETVLSRLRLLA